jgi:hypothetical protein
MLHFALFIIDNFVSPESHYKGASSKDAQPLAFVGKGITFDSGGISLKPSAVSSFQLFEGGSLTI